MTRTVEEKRSALSLHIEKGRCANLLLQDHGIELFLSDMIDHWTDQMIQCDPLDDDGRRGHALKIGALKSVMRHLDNLASLGERAQADLLNIKG